MNFIFANWEKRKIFHQYSKRIGLTCWKGAQWIDEAIKVCVFDTMVIPYGFHNFFAIGFYKSVKKRRFILANLREKFSRVFNFANFAKISFFKVLSINLLKAVKQCYKSLFLLLVLFSLREHTLSYWKKFIRLLKMLTNSCLSVRSRHFALCNFFPFYLFLFSVFWF